MPVVAAGQHHAAAALFIRLPRTRPAGHRQKRHRRIQSVQRQHAAEELVTLVLRVVQVAVAERVQPGRQLGHGDAIAAIDHRRILVVGTKIIGPRIAAAGKFLDGALDGVAGLRRSNRSRHSSPRDRGSNGAMALGRLVASTSNPNWFTPNQVPPPGGRCRIPRAAPRLNLGILRRSREGFFPISGQQNRGISRDSIEDGQCAHRRLPALRLVWMSNQ